MALTITFTPKDLSVSKYADILKCGAVLMPIMQQLGLDPDTPKIQPQHVSFVGK